MAINTAVISGFADEAVSNPEFKLIREQLANFAALGLNHYTPRMINFGDPGEANKNVVDLSMSPENDEVERLIELNEEFGMTVSCIGSPFGKVKLFNKPDDTKNKYFERWTKESTHAVQAGTCRARCTYPG